MKVLCVVATEDAKVENETLRARVLKAVTGGMALPPEPSSTQRVAIELPGILVEALQPIAAAGRVSVGRAFGAYAAACRPRETAATPKPAAEGLRPEQIRCINDALPALRNGKIVLAEVGTGAGKSRIIASLASTLLAERDDGRMPGLPEARTGGSMAAKRGALRAATLQDADAERRAVIVAAPTVANIAHLAREAMAYRAEQSSESPHRAAVLLGRGQFVSRSRIELLLETTPNAEVDRWLANGMPPHSDAGRALASLQRGLYGLTECLKFVAGDWPSRDAALHADDPEDDADAYKAHSEWAGNADLIYTTHTMICLDGRTLLSEQIDSVLPAPLALLIDEGHRLEEAQAAVSTSALALSVLLASLKKSDAWPGTDASRTKALAKAKEFTALLQSLPGDSRLTGPRANIGGDQAARIHASAAELVLSLKDAAKAKRGKTGELNARSRGIVAEVTRTLSELGKPYSAAHLQLSPVKWLPSITVGPRSVDGLLAARWETTPAVFITSGTLLTPTLQGLSPAAIISRLALPLERVHTATPIHPSWLTHIPSVYLPDATHAADLAPPRSDDGASLERWGRNVATHVVRAAQDARGGTLVLCSGFERAKAIAAHLEALGDRLIVQDQLNLNGSACEALFRKKGRPVWLATGGAWTGLDLADYTKDACEDWLLTDLIITAVPFGLVHTSTHKERIARSGFLNEKLAALLTLRQGVGRLIRRPGVTERRLWLLDGRFADRTKAGLMAETRALFAGFSKRSPLT